MKTSVTILTIVAVLATVAALYHTIQLQRAESSLAVAYKDRDAALRRTRELERVVSTPARLKSATVHPTRPKQATEATPSNAAKASGLAQQPLTLKQKVEQRYGPLLSRMNLPPAQSERLIALMMVPREVSMRAAEAAFRAGEDPNGLGPRKQTSDAQVAIEAKIAQEFGPAFLAEYQRYEWELSAINLVDVAQATLSKSGTPMRGDQAAQLVTLLHQYATPLKYNWQPPSETIPYRININDSVLRTVSTVLAPQQLKPFEELIKAQERETARRETFPK